MRYSEPARALLHKRYVEPPDKIAFVPLIENEAAPDRKSEPT